MIRNLLAFTLLAFPLTAGHAAEKKKRTTSEKATENWAGEKILKARVTAVNGELGLDRAISLALKQNPDLLRAIKEIERTRGQVIEVRAQALPHAGFNSSYNQQDKYLLESRGQVTGNQAITVDGVTVGSSRSSFNDINVGDKTWRVAFEVQQLLYSGGQVQAALKIAKFTEDQSYFQLRDIVDRVIARVRTQFYAVLLNRKLIVVSEENIRLLQDELKDQKNRFDAGTVPRFNVLRAEVAVANAQPDLIRAKNNYLIAQLELSKTLGLEAGNRADGKPTFEVVGELRAKERPLNLQRSLAIAKQSRASLKAQKQVILSEEQQITVAEAGYKPRLDANAGWEFRNSRLTDDLSKEVNGWYFGVNGTWNVFDGYETKGKVIQAKARLDSARITYADSVLQVELEVQRAHNSVIEAKELIASQGKVVEQADEALRLARERLAAGAGTQLEVLDAQVALTTARTTQQQALADYNIAIAELDRATGADTMYDDTFKDPVAAKAKAKLRGGATLREEE
jgi:outer membrane protein